VVIDAADLGALTTLTVRLAGGPELRVRTPAGPGVADGDRCRIRIPPERVTVWPAPETEPAAVGLESFASRGQAT
jgi:hypothetical protein